MRPSSASSTPSSRPPIARRSRRPAGAMPPSIDPLLGPLLEALERELPSAVELRQHLHAHPELAHAEQQTAASLRAALPVAARTVAGTGLAALIPGASGAPVAVRA